MLKFWQFDEDEYKDSQPELYWSDEEIKLDLQQQRFEKAIAKESKGSPDSILERISFAFFNRCW